MISSTAARRSPLPLREKNDFVPTSIVHYGSSPQYQAVILNSLTTRLYCFQIGDP